MVKATFRIRKPIARPPKENQKWSQLSIRTYKGSVLTEWAFLFFGVQGATKLGATGVRASEGNLPLRGSLRGPLKTAANPSRNL